MGSSEKTENGLLLRNGRILDPANGVDRKADLLIQEGLVSRVAAEIEAPSGCETADVTGSLVVPGLIDAHVHLRDPGFPDKETLETGCRVAAAGGFTSVACMPNTDPPADSPQIIREIVEKALSADARVYPVACATRNLNGKEITDTEALLEAGAVGFSDDGLPIPEPPMRELLKRSEALGFFVCPHCELLELTRGGHMHEGAVSRELGIEGMPSEGEAGMVERDINLVREVGGRLHILHVSARRSVDLVRDAKREGLSVTCEAMPHHFTLTDEDVRVYGTAAKMSPPLRSADDREAVLEGLADGTVDMIATDHAPHTSQEKLRAFSEAPNGILGLETAVGLVFKMLIQPGVLSLSDAISKLTVAPARLLGSSDATLSLGVRADVTVIDPSKTWTVDALQSRSKSRNTPFHGWSLKGQVLYTILGGRITYEGESQLDS